MTDELPPGVVDYRFTLANERTLLSWIRTALGLSAGAVAVVHLVPAEAVPLGLRAAIGFGLACIAFYVSASAFVRWRDVDRAMVEGRPLPRTHVPMVLACGVAIASALTVVVVALAL